MSEGDVSPPVQLVAQPMLGEHRMNTMTFKVDGRSGDYVKASLVPANHSQEARFGLLDGVIITFFLLCVGGLVYMLVG
jgi:endonuclease V-like protein UPF0215 family